MRKKILVVDGDPQIRESLRTVLRAEGYEVALAANAAGRADQRCALRAAALPSARHQARNNQTRLFLTPLASPKGVER